ncbi:hypothetical protein [Pontiella agarivorans]|uniref:AsmA family protein n=1 Tax=Pontiella agarivorans TaxID=3038953 RepID=A0ABU5N0H4_9BACT|nr:hypothetical protein [Pontiella agarivorans]MDZ8119851.1 hypothetical protein [Pontiella agarivorans]
MKATFKVLGLIFGLGAVILIIIHLVMLFGLTKAMREVVLPRIKAETGIDAGVGRLSINVAKGMLYLDDVEVRNPEGFLLENLASIERINVNVDVKSMLLQKPLVVKYVEVENAVVNVIRNEDGEINLNKLKEGLTASSADPAASTDFPESGKRPVEKEPQSGQESVPPKPKKPLPELLFERIVCDAEVRYLDFDLDQLDIVLDLNLKAANLSTLSDSAAPWGGAVIEGALGNDHNSYVTKLNLRLAPVRDVEQLSFDLFGKIMEIDPRSLESLWKRAGIRPEPFSIEPLLQVREHRFVDSTIRMAMQEIELEDKLSRKLGGMATVESLELSVPITGTLRKPRGDFQGALMSAISQNAGSLLNAWIKGQAEKHGVDPADVPANVDAAVEALGEAVPEIGENEAVKKVLKGLAGGEPSATNAPPPTVSDAIVDMLGEEVKEIGEDEALKQELKNLGKWLFGE